MNRRGFLKALFAGAAAVATPVSALQLVAPELFQLLGDGLHDDAPAIQALIDGDSVIGPDGEVMRGEMIDGIWTVRLPAGTYRMGPGRRIIGRRLIGA